MAILDSLANFANQAKNLSLPGIVAATAFAIMLWPPQPIDKITVQQKERTLDIDTALNWPPVAPLPSSDPRYPFAVDGYPACKDGLRVPLQQGRTIRQLKNAAIINQDLLEETHQSYQKCLEIERVLDFEDDTLITYTNNLLTQRATERAAILEKFQNYSFQLSPVTGSFHKLLDTKDGEIRNLQIDALRYQRIKSERGRRVEELNRLDKEVQARLAEPGRLRPKQQFDDILNGLSSHILGFLTLVLAWSFLLEPVNRAAFSYLYNDFFDSMWDRVRNDRVPDPYLQAIRESTKPDRAGPNFAALKLAIVVIITILLCLLPVAIGGAPERVVQAASVGSSSPPRADSGKKGLVCGEENCVPNEFAQCPPGEVCAATPVSSSRLGTSAPSERKTDLHKQLSPASMTAPANADIKPDGEHPAQVTYKNAVAQQSTTADSRHESLLFLRCVGITMCGVLMAYYLPKVTVDLRDIRATRADGVPRAGDANTHGFRSHQDSVDPTRDRNSEKYKAESNRDSRLRSSTLALVPQLLFYKTPTRKERYRNLASQHTHDVATRQWETAFAEASGSGSAEAAEAANIPGPPKGKSKAKCLKSLEEQWPKLSQPEYAIAMQMIASSDYQNLQQDFYSDSQVSAGLVLPLLLFVWALLYGTVLGLPAWWLYGALALADVLLVMTAVDRRHKFETATDNLIAGGFMLKCKAKEESPDAKSVEDEINAALTAATIYQTTNLKIVPGVPKPNAPKVAPSGSGPDAAQSSNSTTSGEDENGQN